MDPVSVIRRQFIKSLSTFEVINNDESKDDIDMNTGNVACKQQTKQEGVIPRRVSFEMFTTPPPTNKPPPLGFLMRRVIRKRLEY